MQQGDESDFGTPSPKELSAYLSGQLSLFPKNSGRTFLQWNRSKVDFVELFCTVYDSQSVKSFDHKKITKKEFIQLLMWFFNIKIGNWETSLSAAKNRKLERESPYLKELLLIFTHPYNRIG